MQSTVPSSEQEKLARREADLAARQGSEDSTAGVEHESAPEKQVVEEDHSVALQQIERKWQNRLKGFKTHVQAVLDKSLQVKARYHKWSFL